MLKPYLGQEEELHTFDCHESAGVSCLQRCIASRWEVAFVCAFNTTAKSRGKRYNRIYKLNEWFNNESGEVSTLLGVFWKKAQDIVALSLIHI